MHNPRSLESFTISTLGLSTSVLLLMCIAASVLGAVDIPVFVSFDSDNRVDWFYEREEKQVSWDEKYLLRFGIDDLKHKQLGFDLGMITSANFIEQQVLLDHIRLSYMEGKHKLEAASEVIGFGEDYILQDLLLTDPRFDGFLFREMRWNGLCYSFSRSYLETGIGIGGNIHNQASAKAQLILSLHRLQLRLAARTETFDSHHYEPAFTLSLGADIDIKRIRYKTDTVYSGIWFFKSGEPKELYHISQIDLPLKENNCLYSGIVYEDIDIYSSQNVELFLGGKAYFGRLGIIPWFDLRQLTDDQILSANLRCDWQFYPSGRIGIYLKHLDVSNGTKHATIGLQSSLRFDF